jgi:hypothetical protein
MKKPPIDPAELALERARQLKAVQLSKGGGESPQSAAHPEDPHSTVEPSDESAKVADERPEEATAAAGPERVPRKKHTSAKQEKRWKTSVQLSKRHEKIVNQFVNHYRMQGLRPVSVNTIILAALDVLKQTPELDNIIHEIVAGDRRLTRLQ